MPAARARPGTNAGRPHENAQLCFACRSRAKVSSFPLADRLAERTRACRSPASMITRSRIFITAALVCHLLLASRDSNQPDAAPCRQLSIAAPATARTLPTAPARQTEDGYDPGGGTGKGRVHLPPAGRRGNSTIAPTSCTPIKSPTTRTRETANWKATSCSTAAPTTSTSRPVTAPTTSTRKSERSIA